MGEAMVDATVSHVEQGSRPSLDTQPKGIVIVLFGGLLAAGLLFTAYSLQTDIGPVGLPVKTLLPFMLLGVALLIALGFEFVNGFHDTANAVATVIYTHSMPAHLAVYGRGSSTFWACSSHRAPLLSASSRCCPWSSFSRSARAPASPWCSRS